jgi:hypothetical protein
MTFVQSASEENFDIYSVKSLDIHILFCYRLDIRHFILQTAVKDDHYTRR